MPTPQDTIAAIATAPGAAGLAVVRVSGPDALRCADAAFRGAAPLAAAAAGTLHHGWAVECAGDAATPAAPGVARRLDEVVAAVFRAPHSYTREDVVELSCHGGRWSAARVLAVLLRAGARLARPGEFTLRAFLSGRIDLAQAEAVADLIHAETVEAHDLALSQLAGELSVRLAALAEAIADAAAEVEARVDFAEDVGGIEVPAHVAAAIATTRDAIAALLAGAPWARAVREGVRVPIVGRPNVGKSSLLNALAGESRAIVTAAPGTTRDLVTAAVEIAGIALTLVDTAGLRDAADDVERIGIERAREALAAQPLVVWVVDGAEALTAEDRALAAALAGKRVLVVMNKRDVGSVLGADAFDALLDGTPRRAVAVSALRGDGVDGVRTALAELLGAHDAGGGMTAAVSNRRHVDALARARDALDRAARATAGGMPGEIVALELRDALDAVGEISGRSLGEDLLDRIFSRFCIGK